MSCLRSSILFPLPAETGVLDLGGLGGVLALGVLVLMGVLALGVLALGVLALPPFFLSRSSMALSISSAVSSESLLPRRSDREDPSLPESESSPTLESSIS